MLEIIVNKATLNGNSHWFIWKIEILRDEPSYENKVPDGKISAIKFTTLFSVPMLASNTQKK